MKKRVIVSLLVFSFLIFTCNFITQFVYADDFTVLHEFAGVDGDDGREPYGSLVQSGNTLYGMTYWGGNGNGVVFSIGTDGSNHTILHEFAGFPGGGRIPFGSLMLDGDTLYGTTYMGGSVENRGIIFSIGTDGNDFTIIHEFVGGAGDGRYPRGHLIQDGDTLYGMTVNGGADDKGVIFSIEKDGSDSAILHEFVGGRGDGAWPHGSLIQDGDTLYGMAWAGGEHDGGIIFSIGTDGSDSTILHDFAGGAGDGEYPWGSLIQDETILYGMTRSGGANDKGVIFSIEKDGSDSTILHEFAGGVDDGDDPRANLVLRGSTLYGMTSGGGDSDTGIIFSINPDGSDFTILYEFTGGVDGGAEPHGSLICDENNLYGMTRLGGDDDYGIVFSFALPPEEEQDGNGDSGDDDGVTGPHCFMQPVFSGISTATTNEIIVLRHFRDKRLLTNPLGRIFVSAYYKVSPRMAELVMKYPVLKNTVRIILKPTVWLLQKTEK